MSRCERCDLPAEPTGPPYDWRCPDCQTRHVWRRRYVDQRPVVGWVRLPDDMETRQLRNEAEMRRWTRIAAAIGAVTFLVVIALAVFAIMRFS